MLIYTCHDGRLARDTRMLDKEECMVELPSFLFELLGAQDKR